MAAATEPRTGDDLVIERIFDAPRPLVFEMWTKPAHMSKWSMPHGFTQPFGTSEVRPGGKWRAMMRSPQGEELWLSGIYREIVPPERLVFTHQWDGGPETLVTVTFEAIGPRTRMVFWQSGFGSAPSREGHLAGWTQSFERLETYLAAFIAEDEAKARPSEDGKVLSIERRFAAPPALVFRLWTEPQHLVRWWGPEGRHLSHCSMDVRPGGAWRFCMRADADGDEHWIHGTYREVTPPSRLVFTYINDVDGHEMLTSIEFEPDGDGTIMRFRQGLFFTVAERNGHNWGWTSSFRLLDRYIAAL